MNSIKEKDTIGVNQIHTFFYIVYELGEGIMFADFILLTSSAQAPAQTKLMS